METNSHPSLSPLSGAQIKPYFALFVSQQFVQQPLPVEVSTTATAVLSLLPSVREGCWTDGATERALTRNPTPATTMVMMMIMMMTTMMIMIMMMIMIRSCCVSQANLLTAIGPEDHPVAVAHHAEDAKLDVRQGDLLPVHLHPHLLQQRHLRCSHPHRYRA